jgi:hypothetical protein
MNKRLLLLLSLNCLCGFAVSCQQRYSARLIGYLEGGSSPEAAKSQLKKLGFDSGLRERAQSSRDGQGRRVDTMLMAVRFSDLGVPGTLELKFYNDRLMVAEFEPDEPGRYMKLLTEQVGTFSSETPDHSKKISSEVSLSYSGYYGSSRTHPDEGAYLRIAWTYLPVFKEYQVHPPKHSSVFVSQL